MIVSGKTGWRSNPNKVFWAASLSGPWKGGTDIAPAEKKTYDSQNTFELVIKGTEQTTYIYMGDSWDSRGGPSSNYTWLPMVVDSRLVGAQPRPGGTHEHWGLEQGLTLGVSHEQGEDSYFARV